MSRELFGTDGIRGVAGEYPLDRKTTAAVGAALGKWVRTSAGEHPPAVVIGMDTRESGPWIAAEIAGGLAGSGVSAQFSGVTTTPGVAYLAKTGPFAAGVMISASHNPYRDNGIKVIGHDGYKLPDATEELIEKDIFRALESGAATSAVELPVDHHLDDVYADHLAATIPGGLADFDIIADCANGGSYELAPALFARLGARVHTIAASPNGRNINLSCGSLHLEHVRAAVLERGARLGVAFDGDADRALFVSASGRIIDGDAVLLVNGRDLHAQGRLRDCNGQPVVVATQMSNLGLERALQRDGIALVRTPVGDKYVLEEMRRRGAMLGGEQSGHVIFLDSATTGDGILTALRVMDVVQRSGRTLDDLTADLEVFPQLLVNVRVKHKRPLSELDSVQAAIRDTEAEFAGAGRVLVRFSGTEPLARVMVEGRSDDQVRQAANLIADRLRAELGAE
ncbi:MAG TPA: phosphoglucosamine mutase [Bryobacteraceae bacterium]|nr:phosphoglucosamine mutase [Bryobacteraceae bacterium]